MSNPLGKGKVLMYLKIERSSSCPGEKVSRIVGAAAADLVDVIAGVNLSEVVGTVVRERLQFSAGGPILLYKQGV